MADRTQLTVDRHVFASPPASWDTAWATYGWSPALEGPRASRLEEDVPWGSLLARADRPARLSGPVDSVVDPSNRDRLQSAFLPMDGRLGFSVWGAVGSERVGSEWRVLTHTLLMDVDAFRRLGGHPEGLLHLEGRPSPWLERLVTTDFSEPVRLSPVEIDLSASLARSFERGRNAELCRLRDLLLETVGSEALGASLGAIYEVVARSLQGDGVRYVAVRGTGAHSARLLRFVWLSLPLEDRLLVFFQTEQRKTERPRAHLLGLASEEWGRFVPDGAWIVGEDEPLEATPGRAYWATLAADPEVWDAFVDLDRRVVRRGWSLVARDDLTAVAGQVSWSRGWERSGPTVAAALDLYGMEASRTGRPRLHAVGSVLARAVTDEEDLASVEEALARVPAAHRVELIRGAVRVLARRGRPGRRLAGRLRCGAAAGGDPAMGRELHRFVDRESECLRELLASPDDAWHLVEGAGPAALQGDEVARELLRLGAADAAWTAERVDELARVLEPAGAAVGDVVADLVLTLARERPEGEEAALVAEGLLPLLDGAAVDALAADVTRFLEEEAGGHAMEELRLALLLLGADVGASGPVLGKLLLSGQTAARPGAHGETWEALVRDASAGWLGQEAILGALCGVFGLGERRFGAVGDELGPSVLTLACRLLERVGPAGLPEDRAEALLRLLWAAGSDEPLNVLVTDRPEARVPVLAQLLVLPAPPPLFASLRDRLVEALEEGAPVRGVEAWTEGLRAYAPGVLGRFEPRAEAPLLVSSGG